MTDDADDTAPFAELPDGASCGTCAFSELIPVIDGTTGHPMLDGTRQRVCKRFPPAVVMVPFRSAQGTGVAMQATFPPVVDGLYCFEYSEREGPEVIPTILGATN